jgi:hypothetical protein
MTRYSKALAALLGALTPTVLMGILALVGVHVDPTLAAGICTVAAAVAVLIAPANAQAAASPDSPVAPVAPPVTGTGAMGAGQ